MDKTPLELFSEWAESESGSKLMSEYFKIEEDHAKARRKRLRKMLGNANSPKRIDLPEIFMDEDG